MNMGNADILSQQDKKISSSGVFISEHPSSGLPCLSYSFKSRDSEANEVIAVLTNFQDDLLALEELHRVIKIVSGLEESGVLGVFSSGDYRGRLLTGNGREMTSIAELDIEPFVPLINIGVARTGVLDKREYGVSRGFGGCELVVKVPKNGGEIRILHNLNGGTDSASDFVKEESRRDLSDVDEVIVVARKPYEVAQALKDMKKFKVVVGQINDDTMHDPMEWPKPNWRAWVHVDANGRVVLAATTDDKTGREIPLELRGFD